MNVLIQWESKQRFYEMDISIMTLQLRHNCTHKTMITTMTSHLLSIILPFYPLSIVEAIFKQVVLVSQVTVGVNISCVATCKYMS